MTKADYPGSKMVPAANALLSLLTLKLIDKQRLSHIDDFNCDEALGLFAGLNEHRVGAVADSYLRLLIEADTLDDYGRVVVEGWGTPRSDSRRYPDLAEYFSEWICWWKENRQLWPPTATAEWHRMAQRRQ